MTGKTGEAGTRRFNGFTLDLARGALRTVDGAEVPLRPKSFALLRHLAENAGQVVDRDALMQAVWPGIIVTDDSITQCVREIRRVLGDETQQLLRTLPRRGYLLAIPEAALPDPGPPPKPPTGRPLVVVLPFENIGGDPGRAYFADGLTVDLATDLTRFQSLHVLLKRGGDARPWQALLRGSEASGALPQVSRYLVTGSVRQTIGRIRIAAQLEDAETSALLWADRFDRSIDDIFAVQDELARCIAACLVTRIEQEDLRRTRRKPPASLDAYDLCLRGRELHARATQADTLRARDMFERAVETDPEYGAAHAWLAYTIQRGFVHWWGEPRGEAALPLAMGFARRAVELVPDSSFCLSRLAYIQLVSGQYEEALHTGHAAVHANPCDYGARQANGDMLTYVGHDPEAAVDENRFALMLDPFHPPADRQQLGRALLRAGRPEEALAVLRPIIKVLPDYGLAHHTIVVAAYETGHMDEARTALREALRIAPHWTQRTMGSLWPFRDAAFSERFRAAFRATGLPE